MCHVRITRRGFCMYSHNLHMIYIDRNDCIRKGRCQTRVCTTCATQTRLTLLRMQPLHSIRIVCRSSEYAQSPRVILRLYMRYAGTAYIFAYAIIITRHIYLQGVTIRTKSAGNSDTRNVPRRHGLHSCVCNYYVEHGSAQCSSQEENDET